MIFARPETASFRSKITLNTTTLTKNAKEYKLFGYLIFMEDRIMENQVADGRLVVPYDKDRKTIIFYDTFVDMNGDVVKYDDIAIIESGALNSSSMIYFYFSKSFDYHFNFTTYDGAKHKFKRHGYAAYGIGTYKRIKAEYETVAEPMYNIVFSKVADRLIDRIANGASVNIGGLTITKDQMCYTKRKQEHVIDRTNFDRAINDKAYAQNYARIFVRGEKKAAFSLSLNEPNARLLVPIVNHFFTYRPNQG